MATVRDWILLVMVCVGCTQPLYSSKTSPTTKDAGESQRAKDAGAAGARTQAQNAKGERAADAATDDDANASDAGSEPAADRQPPDAGAVPDAAPAALSGKPVLMALVVAMIPILFAYDGWTDSTYVGGEVVNPRRTLPIAIVWGTVLVIATYVLTNLAYYRVLSPTDVATYEAVGSETIGRLVGDWGRHALAVLVAVSTFGTTNGAILTGPRVTQAMAADGLLWRPLARLDPARGTPVTALWAQAALSCVWLMLARGFEDVSGWFVTTSWLFYGLTTAALFVQRARERRLSARFTDYRTPLYPFTPILFVLVTVAIIASDLISSGWRAAAGVGIAALGLPVYVAWKGRGPRA